MKSWLPTPVMGCVEVAGDTDDILTNAYPANKRTGPWQKHLFLLCKMLAGLTQLT
jgi:hypothetical protein